MLNCCIERRKARESSQYSDVSMTDGHSSVVKHVSQTDDDDDDDDEFYECESDTAASVADTSPTQVKSDAVLTRQCDDADGWRDAGLESSLEYTDSLLYQADGRLKLCSDLRLLNVSECLYVPVTQEPAPMTEDMLEEHAEVLARYHNMLLTWHLVVPVVVSSGVVVYALTLQPPTLSHSSLM